MSNPFSPLLQSGRIGTLDIRNRIVMAPMGSNFAETDGNTLVVVTADHDTGGYTLLDGSLADKKVTKSAWVSGGHTAIMVPVFAYGPGADALGGIHNNSAIGQKLIEYVEQSSAKAAKSGALVGAAP